MALNQKPKLKKLHLNGNSLGSNGCTLLLEMLPKDSQLEELGIKTCDVGPSGCSKLAFALRSFLPALNQLRVIHARGNFFGPMLEQLGEAMITRPLLSIILDRSTFNLENYKDYKQLQYDRNKMIEVGSRRLQSFMRLTTYRLKKNRLKTRYDFSL